MRWRHRHRTVFLGLAALLAGCVGPGDKEKKALEAGYTSYTARQYSEAERAASAYIEKYPADQHVDEAYYLRGLCRMNRGDRAGAAADLTAAAGKSQRPDLKVKAARALGDIAFDQKDFPAAAAHYRHAITEAGELQKRAPKSPVPVEPVVYERLADALQAQGDWDGARPWAEKALAANADPAAAARLQAKRAARGFYLQFGVYADPANARAQAAALAKAGVAADAAGEARDGKAYWYVRAGPFRTLAEAEAARQRAAAKKLSPIIVP